jgi:hypothetical protein
MMDSIMKLSYFDEPEYDLYHDLLMKIVKDNGFNLEDPFDWDKVQENGNQTNNISTKEMRKETKTNNIDLKMDSENNSSTKDKPTSSSKVNFVDKKDDVTIEVKRNSFDPNKRASKDIDSSKLKSNGKTSKGCCIIS